MGKKIGATISLDGEKEYRNAINNINKSMSLLNSELKLVTSEFGKNNTSVDALRAKNEVLNKQIAEQSKKITTLNNALKNSEKNFENSKKNIEKWDSELKKAKQKLEELKKSNSASNQEIKNQEKVVSNANKKLEQAQKGYEKSKNKITDWKKKLTDAKTDLNNLNTAVKDNSKKINDGAENVKELNSEFNKLDNNLNKNKDDANTFAETLKANLTSNLITNAVSSIISNLKSLSQTAIEVGMNFSSSMSQVYATLGYTSEQVQNAKEDVTMLSDAAKQMGATTQYSASQAGEALNYLALAGYSAEEAVATLPTVLNLASAGGMELASASDMVTDSASALGIELEDLDIFVDQLAKTSQKSNTSVAQLGEGILTVGATAKPLANGITEMNTVLGILADNGIKASEGGTHLRNIILAMTPSTDKAVNAFKKLKLESYDAQGNLRPLNEIFQDLNNAMKDFTDEQKSETLLAMFNKTDLASVNALLANCTDRFDELSSQIELSSGAAEEMAKVLNDNLKGDITILQSSLEGLGIAVEEKFDGSLRKATQSASSAVSELTLSIQNGELSTKFDKISSSIAKLTETGIRLAENVLPILIDNFSWFCDNSALIVSTLTAVTTVLAAKKIGAGIINTFTTLKTAIKEIISQQILLNSTVNANPYVILASAITGLVVAYKTYTSIAEKTKDEVDELILSTESLINSSSNLREELSNNSATRKTNIDDVKTEISATETLVNRLYELANTESMTNAQKENMKMLIDDINSSMPELSLALNEETGELNKQKSEVLELINANKDLYIAKAMQEQLTDIAKDRASAELKLKDLEERRTEIENELADSANELAEAQIRANRAYEDGRISEENLSILTSDYADNNRELIDELSKLDEEITQQKSSLTQLDSEFSKVSDSVDEHIQKSDKLKTAITANNNELIDSYANLSEEAQKEIKEIEKEYESTVESTANSLRNTFSLFNQYSSETAEKATISKEKILENSREQLRALQEYSTELETLREKMLSTISNTQVAEEMLNQIESAGTDAVGSVKEMNKMSSDELQELAKNWEEQGLVINQVAESNADDILKKIEDITSSATTTVTSELEKMPSIFDHYAKYSVNAFSSAINNNLVLVTQAGVNFGKVFSNSVNNNIKIQTPSIFSLSQKYKSSAKTTNTAEESKTNETYNSSATIRKSSTKEDIQKDNLLIDLDDIMSPIQKEANNKTTKSFKINTKEISNKIKSISSELASEIKKTNKNLNENIVVEQEEQTNKAFFASAKTNTKAKTSSTKKEKTELEKLLEKQSKKLKKQKSELEEKQVYNENWSTKDELKYWQARVDYYKKGTEQRTEIDKTIKNLKETAIDEKLKKDEDYISKLKITDNISSSYEIDYWKKKIKSYTKKTDEWYKIKEKINNLESSLDATRLSDDEDYVEKFKIVSPDITTKDELKYWKKKIKNYEQYSDEWFTIQEKINNLQSNVSQEIISDTEKTIEQKEILDEISLQDEEKYWKKALKKLEQGSDEWFTAKKKINELQKEILSEQYNSDVAEVENLSFYEKINSYEEIQLLEKLAEKYKDNAEYKTELEKNIYTKKKEYLANIASLENEYLNNTETVYANLKSSIDELNSTYEESVESRKNSILSSLSLFSDFDFRTDLDAEDLMYNINTQVDALEEYASTLENLKSRVSDDFFSELKDRDVSELGILQVLAKMTDSELEEYEQLYLERTRLAQTQSEKEFESLKKQTESNIQSLISNANAELITYYSQYVASCEEIGATATKSLKQIENLVDETGNIYTKIFDIENLEEYLKNVNNNEILDSAYEFGEKIGENISKAIDENISKALENLKRQLNSNTYNNVAIDATGSVSTSITTKPSTKHDQMSPDIIISPIQSLKTIDDMQESLEIAINNKNNSSTNSNITSKIEELSENINTLDKKINQATVKTVLQLDSKTIAESTTPLIANNLSNLLSLAKGF